MSKDPRLCEWLQSMGLEVYVETFEKHDVSFQVLRHLSDADLKEIGVSLGHRRILMGAVRQMQASRVAGTLDSLRAGSEQGERRQITVMFCDQVGSTEMSAQLDLDDLRAVMHAYYTSCCNSIEDSGGFIARLIGDGILAYFGYPMAREDAAECAIRAGLKIIEAMERARREGTSRIHVRIGLATGISVISDMVGIGFVERHAATGLTPNLASRVQALAPEDGLVVADGTRRLAGGLFVYEDLGEREIKGLQKPIRLWRVVGESLLNVRFDAYRSQTCECLGRDAELDAVLEIWKFAQLGHCSIVTVVGEAGIGKSRLLRAATERFVRSSGLVVLMQCSPNQSATPLHPLISWIRREARLSVTAAAGNLEQLATWLGSAATPLDLALAADFAGVPISGVDALPPMPPDIKRNMTREVILRNFERHCESAPVLFMFEDVHWTDGATEDFLKTLFRRMEHKPFMAMITSRTRTKRDWGGAASVTEVRLEPLLRGDSERLIRSACRGKQPPPAVVSLILAKTDGIPLFIEELTAAVLESGLLRAEGDTLVVEGPLPDLDIPSTLRDSLTARLDRLNSAKDVARIGSALGREFSFSLLALVADLPTDLLKAALDQLVDAQLLFRRGVSPTEEYVFKHALIQQAAYEGQLRHDRRSLHARIVHAIENHRPEIAAHEPGLMAHHCEQARLADKEVDYLYAAGLASTRLVAIREALSYFVRAEKAASALEQTAHNVERHIAIIVGMMDVGRFAILPRRLVELGAEARRLAQLDGVRCDAVMMSGILFQEGRALLYSSRYKEARQVFEEIRQVGRETRSTPIEKKPASAFSMTLCCQGLFNETLAFINEDNVGYYKEAGSFIDYISGLGWIAYASCQMGSGDDGLRFGDRSVQEAEQLHSPIYLGGAYIWRSHAMMAVRRLDEAVSDARRCVALSRIHSVPYLGWHGLVFLALCLCRKGDLDAATASLAEARSLMTQVGAGQWTLVDYVPAIEAEIASFSGDHERAMVVAARAISTAQSLGGHFAEALAWRVQALSTIRTGGDPEQAQQLFDHAVRLYELGGARAEQAFATLIWAHALQLSGHTERARQSARAARQQAQRYGFELARCEHGASEMLRH
jgi:class 3 adenylate cyclase/tetratricopeptide (TPR) repeat protein